MRVVEQSKKQKGNNLVDTLSRDMINALNKQGMCAYKDGRKFAIRVEWGRADEWYGVPVWLLATRRDWFFQLRNAESPNAKIPCVTSEQIKEWVLPKEPEKSPEERERERYQGLLERDLTQKIKEAAEHRGLSLNDAYTYGRTERNYSKSFVGDRCQSQAELLALIERDMDVVAQKIAALPDAVEYRRATSQHSEVWHINSLDLYCRPGTTAEQIQAIRGVRSIIPQRGYAKIDYSKVVDDTQLKED